MTDAFDSAMGRILSRTSAQGVIISALSGGMDSVVLLHLLAGWRQRHSPNLRVVAAHLNHSLRGEEADRDQEFSRRLAVDLGVEFAEQRVDAAIVARVEGVGIEEAGRILRYRFFHTLGGDDALVLTGHHADDQAETILMNLRRGAHRRGLSGMRQFAFVPAPPNLHVRVGRPLLTVERQALADYAREMRLSWREDKSNSDPVYTRNRIRHRVIPMLENILPGFRIRLLEKAAAMAREEEEYAAAGRALADLATRRENGGRVFLLSEEALSDPERFIYALRHVAEEEMGARLPYGAVLSRLSELAAAGRNGETVSLPGRLRVRKEPDGLFFFFPGGGPGDAYTEFILPDPPFDIRAYGLAIRADWRSVYGGRPPEEDMADPEVEWINPAAVRWPLRLRPPRPGERFRPMGAPGSKKIHDIMTDLKTPRRKRDLPRVLADHAGGLWLWPLRLGHRAQLPESATRALRIEIRE